MTRKKPARTRDTTAETGAARGADPRETAVAIQVLPRASRDAVVGERQGAIVIRLKAPPVDGAANEALRRFLADQLGVAASAVRLLRRAQARRKWIAVEGWSAAAVSAVLLSQPAVALEDQAEESQPPG